MALGSEKVTNGGFPSATTGWTAQNNATLASVSGGQAGNCLRTTGDASNNPAASQGITTVVGKPYKLCWYAKQGTESTIKIGIGSAAWDNRDLYSSQYETTASWVKSSTTFIATSTTTYISFTQVATAGAGTTIFVDEISLKPIGSFARDGMFMGMGLEM